MLHHGSCKRDMCSSYSQSKSAMMAALRRQEIAAISRPNRSSFSVAVVRKMKPQNWEAMSTEDLWVLHEQVVSVLIGRIAKDRARLDQLLQQLKSDAIKRSRKMGEPQRRSRMSH
jgi:hypothetical protein